MQEFTQPDPQFVHTATESRLDVGDTPVFDLRIEDGSLQTFTNTPQQSSAPEQVVTIDTTLEPNSLGGPRSYFRQVRLSTGAVISIGVFNADSLRKGQDVADRIESATKTALANDGEQTGDPSSSYCNTIGDCIQNTAACFVRIQQPSGQDIFVVRSTLHDVISVSGVDLAEPIESGCMSHGMLTNSETSEVTVTLSFTKCGDTLEDPAPELGEISFTLHKPEGAAEHFKAQQQNAARLDLQSHKNWAIGTGSTDVACALLLLYGYKHQDLLDQTLHLSDPQVAHEVHVGAAATLVGIFAVAWVALCIHLYKGGRLSEALEAADKGGRPKQD